MEPAAKEHFYQALKGQVAAQPTQPERKVPEWETKVGKIIFYLTCALGLWFFYWLNGIQCPC
jgi:hypothetical protein